MEAIVSGFGELIVRGWCDCLLAGGYGSEEWFWIC